MFSFVLTLTGCWSTDLEEVSFDLVPFESDYVITETAVIETLTTGLECPDGEPASFYAVYDPEQGTNQGVALVFHSSAFDYVVYPQSQAPLAGVHYAPTDGEEHRMSQTWGVKKSWETMGLYPQVDTTEVNSGTLAGALVNRGLITLYPINCWGDLWHNRQDNDLPTEFLERSGGQFADWMIRAIQEESPSFLSGQELGYKQYLDPNEIYYVGLGDGARGVIELLRSNPDVSPTAVMLDSPVDDLLNWSDRVSGVEEGMRRIYAAQSDDLTALQEWSMEALISEGRMEGIRTMIVYSSDDPRVPYDNLDGLISAHEGKIDVCFSDVGVQFPSSHVFTNRDISLAQRALNWTIDGTGIDSCETSYGGAPEDPPEDTGGGDTGGGDTGGGDTADTGR